MKKNVNAALEILALFGADKSLLNKRSALVLLTLAGVKPDADFRQTSNQRYSIVGNKRGRGYSGIMQFMREEYDANYAENSRETIRRTDIHQMVQLGLVEHNADDKTIPTNSSRNHYSLRPEIVAILRNYGKRGFRKLVETYIETNEERNQRYTAKKTLSQVQVTLPDGREISFSPGDHNELQGRIIESFSPQFTPGAEVLYVGDTANKYLLLESDKLRRLGLDLSRESHTKLPDVVLHDVRRNWLIFVEAVTSHGPIGKKRMHELETMANDLSIGVVYVTAFLDRSTFRKYSADIAWETEVWIAETPKHMIHFNGDRFLGPRK